MRAFSHDDIALLRLARTRGIGPITFHRLLTRYGCAAQALANHQSWPKKNMPLATQTEVEDEIATLEKAGGTMVLWGEGAYPQPLSHIEDAPPVLSVLGSLDTLQKAGVGIVGNRNASGHALRFTHQLAGELSRAGHNIISGLARGVDGAAHEGALSANGPTIAVVAGGVNHIYPRENTDLYHRISAHGAIVSEMPWGSVPTHQHFPRRNRIISGLAHGVCVVEAPVRSGSLITARYALEQGRDVFAVPGSPTDPRAAGPNKLIKQGAHVVENADDICSALPTHIAPPPTQPSAVPSLFDIPPAPVEQDTAETNMATTPLEALLSSTPVSVDELIRLSGTTKEDVLINLTEMEVMGTIERTPRGIALKNTA